MGTESHRGVKLALLSGLFLFAGLSLPPGASSRETGWKFDQTSDFYGKQTAYLCNKGIRLSSEKMGITFVMTAPDWRVAAYNVKNKTCIDMPYSQWRKTFFGQKRRPGAATGPIKKGGTALVGGLTACQYFGEDIHRPSVKPGCKLKQAGAGNKLYNTEFWVVPSIKPPLPLTELLTEAVAMPNGMGMPVRLIQFNSNGRTLVSLETKKCERISIDPAIFSIPKGCKRVKDEMMLLLNEDSDSDLASLLGGDDSLGLTADKPRKGKRSGQDTGKLKESLQGFKQRAGGLR